MSCHFITLSLSLLSPITFLLYVQALAVIPGASWCQTVEDLLLMPAAASGCPTQLFELLILISNVVSMQLEFFIFPGCLFSLAHLELFGIYFSIPWGKQDSLQLLLSTCMEDTCSSDRENSLLPLYVDVFLRGDCTLKLAVTPKLLHTHWAYAGTMSANGRAFAELVANLFTVYFLPKNNSSRQKLFVKLFFF